jgi:hypothetical protein
MVPFSLHPSARMYYAICMPHPAKKTKHPKSRVRNMLKDKELTRIFWKHVYRLRVVGKLVL